MGQLNLQVSSRNELHIFVVIPVILYNNLCSQSDFEKFREVWIILISFILLFFPYFSHNPSAFCNTVDADSGDDDDDDDDDAMMMMMMMMMMMIVIIIIIIRRRIRIIITVSKQ